MFWLTVQVLQLLSVFLKQHKIHLDHESERIQEAILCLYKGLKIITIRFCKFITDTILEMMRQTAYPSHIRVHQIIIQSFANSVYTFCLSPRIQFNECF